MRLTINDPAAIPSLLAALHEGGCVADHAGPDCLEVLFPWLVSAKDAEQALTELAFFVRAWEADNPGVTVDVTPVP